MNYPDLYSYILGEEKGFELPIDLNGWPWSMKQQLTTSFFYKHGRLRDGSLNEKVAYKNIIRPILNLQYRAEDIDVKDIVLYVDDPSQYHLSFLIKKYHDDVFVVENDLDTFIDEWKESKIDYGAGLIRKNNNPRPDVIDLQSIAFCDQTDILKGPIAFKHYYNPGELKDMEEVGWGSPENGATSSIDDLILMAENERQSMQNKRENSTPGAYIEVYEVHGVLPTKFFDPNGSDYKYQNYLCIVAFYQTKNKDKKGVVLFQKKLTKSMLKVALRDKVYSRGLGFGSIEELSESQVGTNYGEIRKQEMIDAASKIILKAVGAEMKSRYPNGLKDVENLQIIELNQGEDLQQIDTTPRSMVLFEKAIQDWQDYARTMGAATDPILGEQSPSGTPFRAQALLVSQAQGLHDYRKGKFAKDLEAVYRDWIIPYIVKKITSGVTFLSELSTDEMQYVADKLVENMANKFTVDAILNGETVTPELVEEYKAKVRQEFVKKGNKHFFEILKGEFSRQPIKVKINISNKQKDLTRITDSLVNIFRQIMVNPQGFIQMMQVPEIAKTFNSILEYSGLSPVMYAGLKDTQAFAPQPTPQAQLAQFNPQAQPALTS